MVSRMEELRAEITAERRSGSEGTQPRHHNRESTGEIMKRLADRERLALMEQKGEVRLGSGEVPGDFWTLPRPKDPKGSVRSALLDDRDESY